MKKPHARKGDIDKIAMLAYKLLTGEIAAKAAQRRPSLLDAEIGRREQEKAAMNWSGMFGGAGERGAPPP